MDKPRLRLILREKRKQFHQSFNAKNFHTLFFDNFSWVKGRVVAGYEAIGSEVNIHSILEGLSQEGSQCLLPSVTEGSILLSFTDWKSRKKLSIIPEVFLVPILGFDRFCHRLGQGGGYYDKTLSVYKDAIRIGIAYDCQEVDRIPVEAHDEPLHYILTETRILKR